LIFGLDFTNPHRILFSTLLTRFFLQKTYASCCFLNKAMGQHQSTHSTIPPSSDWLGSWKNSSSTKESDSVSSKIGGLTELQDSSFFSSIQKFRTPLIDEEPPTEFLLNEEGQKSKEPLNSKFEASRNKQISEVGSSNPDSITIENKSHTDKENTSNTIAGTIADENGSPIEEVPILKEIMSGWLQKQTVERETSWAKSFSFSTFSKQHSKTPNTNTSSWKNRFFVLRRSCLYYYIVQTEEKIKLDDDLSVNCPSHIPKRLRGIDRIGYEFSLETNNQSFQLATPTEEELVSWLNFFTNYTSCKIEGKSSWLFVYDSVYKKWAVRYCYAKHGEIECTKREERGYLPLYGSKVNTDIPLLTYNGFCFSITNSILKTVLNLSAETDEMRMQWIQSINGELKRMEKEHETLTDRLLIELSENIHDAVEKEKYENEKKNDSPEKPIIEENIVDNTRTKKRFFILSIDGGGLRGIITILILARILEKFPDFLSKIDFITGCSNGGMVAMALAFGHGPKFCHRLLEMTGETIFKTGMISTKVNSAKFRNVPLKLLCDIIWQEKKLKDAKMRVMIPAFLLDNRQDKDRSSESRIFHNIPACSTMENDSTSYSGEELASDVVMRTIAAPTYFPSYQQYVDGGLFAHDPSSLALSLSLSPKRLNKRPEEIAILSLGTGRVFHYYEDKTHDWGYYQWIPRLPSCFWDGMLSKSAMICSEILGSSYHRLDPLLEKEIAMDDPLMIPYLTEVAKKVDLTETLQWIEEHLYRE